MTGLPHHRACVFLIALLLEWTAAGALAQNNAGQPSTQMRDGQHDFDWDKSFCRWWSNKRGRKV